MAEETKKTVRSRERGSFGTEKDSEKQTEKKLEKKFDKKPVSSSTNPISLEKLNSEAPAVRGSSIMSAPDEKHFPTLFVVSVGLVVSVILNIIAIVAIIAKSETISILRDQIMTDREDIEDLKEQLNALDNNS